MPYSRIPTYLIITAIIALSWGWIVPMAVDMYGPMTGPSAWMMTTTWDAPRLVLLWAMWAVMMAAMMLPSAVPLLTFYDRAIRRTATRQPSLHVAAMISGYLLMWGLFSVGATVLQRALTVLLIVNPMMELSSRTAVGMTLLVAGTYQLTPWKGVCLRHCRSPLSFVMQGWRRGIGGAFRMGAEHGVYCLGCCWALMLLLFAGGVMNLVVIVGLTVIVLIEKVAPMGTGFGRALGAGLMIAGALWLAGG